MIKNKPVKTLYLLQALVFILLGILLYFSYENKTTWDLQVDINDTLLKKSPGISSTWRLQLDINEVVMERFHWIGENRPQQKIGVKKLQKGELHED